MTNKCVGRLNITSNLVDGKEIRERLHNLTLKRKGPRVSP